MDDYDSKKLLAAHLEDRWGIPTALSEVLAKDTDPADEYGKWDTGLPMDDVLGLLSCVQSNMQERCSTLTKQALPWTQQQRSMDFGESSVGTRAFNLQCCVASINSETCRKNIETAIQHAIANHKKHNPDAHAKLRESMLNSLRHFKAS